MKQAATILYRRGDASIAIAISCRLACARITTDFFSGETATFVERTHSATLRIVTIDAPTSALHDVILDLVARI